MIGMIGRVSLADLPELIQKPHFAANKLMLDYDPLAYQCQEDWCVQVAQNLTGNALLLRTHSQELHSA